MNATRSPLPTAVLLLLVLAPWAAAADDEDDDDAPIVVTARGRPTPAAEAGTSITSIDLAELDRDGVDELTEAIRRAPGVWVTRGGGVGQPSSIFVRGAASNQTKVLLDGFSLNDPTLGGQLNPYDLTLAGLGRVEVLRGSQSTLHGSEAIGGVVQMLSRDYRGPTFVSMRAGGGSFRTFSGRVEVGGGDDGFAGGGFLSFLRTDNDADRQDFDVASAGARFEWGLSDQVDVGLTVRHVRSEAQDPFDFGNPLPRDANIRRERDTTLLGGSFTWRASPVVTLRAGASWTGIESRFRNGGDAPGDPDELDSESRANVYGGRVAATTDLLAAFGAETANGTALALTTGVELERARSFNETVSPFGTTTVRDDTLERAYFLQADATLFGALHLGAGARLTDHDFAGEETTWSLSALYRFESTGTDVGANASTGFRAPTPVEFADPFVGNEDLEAERSESFDVGVRQRLIDDALVAEVTLFQLEVDDLIAFDPDAFRLANFSRTRTRGVEMALGWEIDERWSVGGALTWQDPENLDAGPGEEDQLPNRSCFFGTGWGRYRIGAWDLFASYTYSEAFPEIGITGADDSARRHPGRKHLLNVGASWRPHDAVRLFGRVENLLDDTYVENERGPRGNGIGVFLGVELTLR